MRARKGTVVGARNGVGRAIAVAVALAVCGMLAWQLAALRRAGPGAAPVLPMLDGRPAGAQADPIAASSRPTRSANGVVNDEVRETRAIAAAVERHLRMLAREGDPRQRLLAHYVLLADGRDAAGLRQAQQLASRMLAESPDDEVLALAQAWFCTRNPACDDAASDAWMRAAPDNGAAYMGLLAGAGGDAAQVDDALELAARASQFDVRWHALQRETLAALDGLELPPAGPHERALLRGQGLDASAEDRRRLIAAGITAALPMPAFTSLARSCRPPVSQARARHCRSVLVRMARASSLIERGLALSLLEQLTRGSAEGAYWAAHKRDGQWQAAQLAQVGTGRAFWLDLQQYGEVVAIQRAMTRTGIPLQAPRGWVPAFP